MAFPDAWSETALVSITAIGESAIQFASVTENIDMDVGDKPIDFLANLMGGRLEKLVPEEDTTVTIEAYVVELDTASNSGLMQLFHTTSSSWDTNEPLEVISDLGRDKFRIAILWTNNANQSTAEGSTGPIASESYRFVMKQARLISAKSSFTDGMLKITFKLKAAPRQKNGTRNIMWESGDGTAIPALSSYTTANNGF